MDIKGVPQKLQTSNLRERAAAFPLDLPYRLINMYSIHGDTVLDPFWGTGTTTLATMACARNSIGYEIDPAFREGFQKDVKDVKDITNRRNARRIRHHIEFVEKQKKGGQELKYQASHYDFNVRKQEKEILFHTIKSIERKGTRFTLQHEKYEPNSELLFP